MFGFKINNKQVAFVMYSNLGSLENGTEPRFIRADSILIINDVLMMELMRDFFPHFVKRNLE